MPKAKKRVAASDFLPSDERRAQGKALRDLVSRESQGHWKARKDRRDPVELLKDTNKGRLAQLIPIRFGRMMQSPFAFYRGSAALMAADLATTPHSGIKVQLCGDAHLANFGGFATPERRVIFDINDFDETLPGPWEWDVKRLATSFILAGRHIRLPEKDSARAAAAAVRSYREHMADYAEMRALEVWYDAIDIDRFLKEIDSDETRQRVEKRLAEAREKSEPEFLFPKLAKHVGAAPVIVDEPPLIFHPTADVAPGVDTQFKEQWKAYRESLPEHVRVLFDRFRFCDLAFKAVGVGSVGTMCAIALFQASENDTIFLQIKEASDSVLAPYLEKSAHGHNGERVVAGQRLMQAASDMFLGWSRGVSGRDFYVRQLRDVKVSAIFEAFDEDDLRNYGRLCGWALARAHARSGDAALVSGYMGSSDVFDNAICEFAVEYADQTQRDHRAFVKAVREGRISAVSND
ncbi:MAG: DUF2252 domain-containing protein [Reyranellaceae bacterium]